MTALSGTSLLSAFSCASTLALYSSSEGTMTTARRDMPSKGRTLRLWAFGYTFVYVVFGGFANSTMHVGRDRVWSFRERIRIVRSIDDQVMARARRGKEKEKEVQISTFAEKRFVFIGPGVDGKTNKSSGTDTGGQSCQCPGFGTWRETSAPASGFMHQKHNWTVAFRRFFQDEIDSGGALGMGVRQCRKSEIMYVRSACGSTTRDHMCFFGSLDRHSFVILTVDGMLRSMRVLDGIIDFVIADFLPRRCLSLPALRNNLRRRRPCLLQTSSARFPSPSMSVRLVLDSHHCLSVFPRRRPKRADYTCVFTSEFPPPSVYPIQPVPTNQTPTNP